MPSSRPAVSNAHVAPEPPAWLAGPHRFLPRSLTQLGWLQCCEACSTPPMRRQSSRLGTGRSNRVCTSRAGVLPDSRFRFLTRRTSPPCRGLPHSPPATWINPGPSNGLVHGHPNHVEVVASQHAEVGLADQDQLQVCVDAALAGYSLEQRRTFAHSNKVSRRVHTCPLYTCPLPHVCRRST